MKNKITISAFLLISLFLVKGAAGKSLSDTSGLSVIHNYVRSFMHTNAEELNRTLDDNAVMKMPRFKQVIVQTKDQLVEENRLNEGTSQSCSSEIAVLSSSDAIILAEVKFKYTDFQEHVYLTVERSNSQWKITQIVKMFSDESSATNSVGNLTAK